MHMLIDNSMWEYFGGTPIPNVASEWPCQWTITRQLCICLWSFQLVTIPPGFLRAKAAMLSARLSHRNSVRRSVRPSVRPSVTRVDQAKTVQARITKFLPSAAW